MQARHTRFLKLNSPAESEAFGQRLAPVLGGGDTILLSGEIGAGKSFLSRAIIQSRLSAEGRLEDVPSPTFTLVQVYELSGTEIWHCDLYRLVSADEVLELGLEDAFQTAICLVEWPDRLEDLAPASALRISLAAVPGEEETRDMELSSVDPRWMARLDPIMETVQQ
ncbi:MAG: tRNA (adenosine(37)-N6)-threonylcarbamoyltransferase complex ATPase subunit type 1 TsaE [Pseudomonadota bacterium]